MKRYSYLFVACLFFLMSCVDTNQYSHIEVYNSFTEPVQFTLNKELHNIKPKELAYFASPKRAQLFEFGQVKQLIKTKENERFLINLALDTIIKEEILYGTSTSPDPNSSGINIPTNLFKFRGQKYFGLYEVITQQLVLENMILE